MRHMYLLSLGLLFALTGNIMNCSDYDECKRKLICGENANCFNTFGNYYFQCQIGFSSAGNTQPHMVSCKDIDECAEGLITRCPNPTNCVNRDGDYYCTHKSAFISSIGNKKFLAGLRVRIVDINASLEGITCGPNTNCLHDCTCGYNCTCISGFISSSGSKTCPGELKVWSVDVNITPQEVCTIQTTKQCLEIVLVWIEVITAQELPLNMITSLLNMALETKVNVPGSSSVKEHKLASYGSRVLENTEKAYSTLVKPTNTSDNVSFNFADVEGRVFMVGQHASLDEIIRLETAKSSIEIDLIDIAKNNNKTGSAAVVFIAFNTMENLLKADFFNTTPDMNNTLMSTVVSVTLPNSNTKLTKPVNITFRHIREFDPNGSLSCVYWHISEWTVKGCSVSNTNSSHTVCSYDHLSTFALIMQSSGSPSKSDLLLDRLNLVFVIVGLLFFSLTLLTFALCQWSPGVNNVARINICISLLLAHLLFLLTQTFLSFIRHQQVLCAIISGLLHFLFLSGFVWMFIESVLLFICVKNLSKVSSKKREALRSKFLCVTGYGVALVVVAVSVAVVYNGYGSEKCWIKTDKDFIWSFLGPVCIILASNTILFISISIILISAFKKLNAEDFKLKQTKIMLFKALAQFVILGCSWILGFFTNSSKVLEVLFLILNSQQGTFIFLIYCILNYKIRQQYKMFFKSFYCGLYKRSWSPRH